MKVSVRRRPPIFFVFLWVFDPNRAYSTTFSRNPETHSRNKIFRQVVSCYLKDRKTLLCRSKLVRYRWRYVLKSCPKLPFLLSIACDSTIFHSKTFATQRYSSSCCRTEKESLIYSEKRNEVATTWDISPTLTPQDRIHLMLLRSRPLQGGLLHRRRQRRLFPSQLLSQSFQMIPRVAAVVVAAPVASSALRQR